MFDKLESQYSSELEFIEDELSQMGYNVPDVNPLLLQIDGAYKAIRNYLRLDDNADMSKFYAPAVMLAITYYNNYIVNLKKAVNDRAVTQITENSRSITFASAEIKLDTGGLTSTVKSMLPYPPVWAY